MDEKTLARFWSKVEKTEGCWLWRGAVNNHGYGLTALVVEGKRAVSAHRASWRIHHGVWPMGCVLHSCDNPACVRPDHLRDGSMRDNAVDMSKRGRCRIQKVSPEKARVAILRYRGGESQASLRKFLGLSKSATRQLLTGMRWRWLHEEIRDLPPSVAQAAGNAD